MAINGWILRLVNTASVNLDKIFSLFCQCQLCMHFESTVTVTPLYNAACIKKLMILHSHTTSSSSDWAVTWRNRCAINCILIVNGTRYNRTENLYLSTWS